jgi:hypothetical protein
LWAELDAQQGVKYAHGILDPWAAIFSGPTREEVAKAASEFAFVGETPVPVATLQAIPEARLRECLSTKTASAFVTARTSAATLTAQLGAWDRPVQQEILRLALAV